MRSTEVGLLRTRQVYDFKSFFFAFNHRAAALRALSLGWALVIFFCTRRSAGFAGLSRYFGAHLWG
jgi:hypothetical protein